MSAREKRPAGPPRNVRAIEDRSRNLAARGGVPHQRVRHRITIVALVDMLRTMPGVRPVLKGGSALMLRLGPTTARFSKDIDAAIEGDLSAFHDALIEHGRIPHDGFTFRVVKPEVIAASGTAQQPRRIQVKLEFHGKPFGTVQLEVACVEAGSTRLVDTVLLDDLTDLGFDRAVKIDMLTVPYQVAQKLHACTERCDGWVNPRAHDLVDLALLAPIADEQLPKVRAACVEIFAARGQHPWPPRLVPEAGWETVYRKARDESDEQDLPADLHAAVAATRDFTDRIEAAR